MSIQAYIKGKISSTGSNISETSEDLFTSILFQNISYLDYQHGLYLLLSSARNVFNDIFLPPTPSSVLNVKYEFWNRYKYSEPDVIITIELANKEKYLIFIEMKLYSGKSNYMQITDGENNIIDQLKREYDDLIAEKNYDRHLIYITRELFPRLDIEESEKHIKSDGVIFHISYSNIYKCLHGQFSKINDWRQKKITSDLLDFLKYYKFDNHITFDEKKYVSVKNYIKIY